MPNSMMVGKAALNQFILMDINRGEHARLLGGKMPPAGKYQGADGWLPDGIRNLDWIVDPVQVQKLCLMIDHIAAYMTKMR